MLTTPVKRCIGVLFIDLILIAHVHLSSWRLNGMWQLEYASDSATVASANDSHGAWGTCDCRHNCHEWPTVVHSANQSCPLYLEASYNFGAGLGHSFMSFNHVVVLAAKLSLTLRSHYQTTGHGMSLTGTRQFFFGNLFWAAIPPNWVCQVEVVESEKSLVKVVQQSRNSCSRGTSICRIFRLSRAPNPSEAGLNVGMYRKLFDSQRPVRVKHFLLKRLQFLRPRSPADSIIGKQHCITIAVHIRRGDIAARPRYRTRWIAGTTYLSLLRLLVDRLSQMFGSSLLLRVILFCEGLRNRSQVPEADGSYTDFARGLQTYHVQLLPSPRDGLESFDLMCNSDVLVTAPSGFGHLSALLCNIPIVLAVPFWLSYKCVPTALLCNVNRSTSGVITKITFDDHAFQHRISNHNFQGCRSQL